MKHLHHHIIAATCAALAAAGCPTPILAAVIPVEESGPKLPGVWASATPSQIHEAIEAAELDADRLLAERVYGLEIESGTRIRDLVFDGKETSSRFSARLVGATESKEPQFLADGTVLVFRAIKVREVLQNFSKSTEGKVRPDGSVEVGSSREKTTIANNDSVIDVTGNSALPGSEGHQKIMAKRAAELDAYRRLAKRMFGIQIDGETTLRKIALENDRVGSALSAVLKGAETTKVAFDPENGSCKVTMKLKTADVVRTTIRAAGPGKIQTSIKDEIEESTFTETGTGTMREIASGDTPDSAPATAQRSEQSDGRVDPFFETTTIIREVLRTEPVIN